MRFKSRRGVTLAELTIAMAVVSIVAIMVVSFATLVGDSSKDAQSKLDTMTDIALIESIVEGWIDGATDTIVIKDDGSEMHYEHDDSKEVLFDKNRNAISLNGQRISVGENIKSVKFDESEDSSIYYCTIEYTVRGVNENEKYTFCVNPRIR